jgi:GntR family transcriptional regulator
MTKITRESERLKRDSDIPLHRQLQQILLAEIEAGKWMVGQLIPREVDLMEEYGLSRYTVRQALEGLEQVGYLDRTKKKGSVVARPKVEQNLSHFYSFALDMAAQGLEPTSRVLSLEEIIPDEETALLLQSKLKNKVYHLRRLRMVNDEPLLIESSYVSFEKPIDLGKHDWHVLPLYYVLETYYGIKVERAEEFLEPVNLEPCEAEILGVSANAPAFRVERHTFDKQGHLFERRISLIRGDRYRFKVTLAKVELLG